MPVPKVKPVMTRRSRGRRVVYVKTPERPGVEELGLFRPPSLQRRSNLCIGRRRESLQAFLVLAGGDGIFLSTDGGSSWNTFNSGLTCPDVRSLAVNSAGTALHAGTNCGGVFDFTTGRTSRPKA